jgi:hypothetical protein
LLLENSLPICIVCGISYTSVHCNLRIKISIKIKFDKHFLHVYYEGFHVDTEAEFKLLNRIIPQEYDNSNISCNTSFLKIGNEDKYLYVACIYSINGGDT